MSDRQQSRTASGTVISVPSILIVFLLLAAASYGALIWAPTENTMGVVQRIFYFHVSSAWAGFVAFTMVFIGGVAYLRTRAPKWDWLSVASAEVGVAFFYCCAGHWAHLGQAGVGNLVDVGRAHVVFVFAMGVVCQLSGAAHAGR